MAWYYNATRGEKREMDPAFFASAVAAGNPKVDGWELLALVAPPVPTETQRIVEGTPTLINGVWTQTWVVQDITAELNAIKDAQAQRDVDQLFGKVLFELVNDVRVLKGQGTITLAQFINYLRSKL